MNKTKIFKDPCGWCSSTIVQILKKREYLGQLSISRPASTSRTRKVIMWTKANGRYSKTPTRLSSTKKPLTICSESGGTPGATRTLAELESELLTLDIGPLLVQSFIAQGVTLAVGFVIFIIVYGRLIEIYSLTSLAPLPLATLSKPGVWRHGAKLLQVAVRHWFPRSADYSMRGHLRRDDTEYRHGHQRRYLWGDMGGDGLHTIALLYALQDRQPCQSHIWRTLNLTSSRATMIVHL